MTAAPAVLLAVATELAKLAKSSLPELQDEERTVREWYSNGVYYRETALGNDTFISQYNFQQRKSRRMAVEK